MWGGGGGKSNIEPCGIQCLQGRQEKKGLQSQVLRRNGQRDRRRIRKDLSEEPKVNFKKTGLVNSVCCCTVCVPSRGDTAPKGKSIDF